MPRLKPAALLCAIVCLAALLPAVAFAQGDAPARTLPSTEGWTPLQSMTIDAIDGAGDDADTKQTVIRRYRQGDMYLFIAEIGGKPAAAWYYDRLKDKMYKLMADADGDGVYEQYVAEGDRKLLLDPKAYGLDSGSAVLDLDEDEMPELAYGFEAGSRVEVQGGRHPLPDLARWRSMGQKRMPVATPGGNAEATVDIYGRGEKRIYVAYLSGKPVAYWVKNAASGEILEQRADYDGDGNFEQTTAPGASTATDMRASGRAYKYQSSPKSYSAKDKGSGDITLFQW